MDCRVLYDYKAVEDDELDLRKGELVSDVKSGGDLEDGWWSGVLNGKEGVFPNNFVEPISSQLSTPNPAPVQPPVHSNTSPPSNVLGHNAPKYSPAQSDPAMRTGVNRVQRARVTFSYKPVNNDELKLEIGDTVEIFGQIEDGWMSGSNKGARGVFPSNFVEFIEESAPPTAADPPPKDPKNKIPAGGIALPILPVQGGKPSEKKYERAKVTFTYDPQEDDELKLEVGDVVDVLNKEHAEGWWEGRLNGKSGVFPNNFVELIPDTTQKSVLQKPLLKPTQAPRTDFEPEPSLPRKPSVKGPPVQAPKRGGPTNELQRKLDRRNKLNVGGPEPVPPPPTDNGLTAVPPQPPQPQRTVQGKIPSDGVVLRHPTRDRVRPASGSKRPPSRALLHTRALYPQGVCHTQI
eukprot:TRINITY_DN6004_c0_g1_i5.p1 TRINITY_DN6004_c0_g1~~TRINITY_DN6004_c0_g1_i5.p1  ORF type:complete len:405 (+),score=71.88 TRINITY_DN6004_c0_g1_i5:46-1260(+)